MSKIVSQLDERGYFVGPVQADQSPLEPGVFLIPGGAVDLDPPVVAEGKQYRINDSGDGWIEEDIPMPEPEPEPPVITPPAVPTQVTMRQAQLALLDAGLLDQVNTLIGAMTGVAGQKARITWNTSSTVSRTGELVLQLAPQLNLNDAAIDALFVAAAKQ